MVFALLILFTMAVGVIQIAVALFGRNVIVNAAHEAARAAVEVGRDQHEAELVARRIVSEALGKSVTDLRVTATSARSDAGVEITVEVHARLLTNGPLPLGLPVSATAVATSRGPAP